MLNIPLNTQQQNYVANPQQQPLYQQIVEQVQPPNQNYTQAELQNFANMVNNTQPNNSNGNTVNIPTSLLSQQQAAQQQQFQQQPQQQRILYNQQESNPQNMGQNFKINNESMKNIASEVLNTMFTNNNQQQQMDPQMMAQMMAMQGQPMMIQPQQKSSSFFTLKNAAMVGGAGLGGFILAKTVFNDSSHGNDIANLVSTVAENSKDLTANDFIDAILG